MIQTSPTLAIAALLGAIILSGLMLGVTGLVGTSRPTGPPSRTRVWLARTWRGPGRTSAERRRRQLVLLATVVVGAGAWLVSGVPVIGLVAATFVPGVPWLFAVGKAERRAIDRVEAVGEWTRRLRDVVGTGIGLQAAIVTTATTAPPAIAEQVRMLASRLQAGWRGQDALRQYAEDIGDPVCDQVVAALMLHLTDRGEQLEAVLSSIAAAATAEVSMRAEIDAERASARFTVRFLAGFTVVVVAIAATRTDYMRPYATPTGQLIMLGLALVFFALLAWVRTLSQPQRVPRLLGPLDDPARERRPGG